MTNFLSFRFFIFLFFIFFYTKCFSQNGNYKITYRHNLQYDTLKMLRDTIGLEAILFGNSNESNYSFAKAPKKISPSGNNEKSIQDIINSKKGGTSVVKGNSIPYDSVGNMVYQNKKLKKLFVREKMLNEYVLTEEITPAINWIITDEIKSIKNYTCKKATAYFRGRDYTAWFTVDIPIVAGPWKFFGLPGLLMDIEDSKHQVKIYVEKIEYPTSEKVQNFSNSGTKVSLERYVTYMNEEYKKMLKGIETMLLQQDHMQEAIEKRLVNYPTVKSTATFYCIETRID